MQTKELKKGPPDQETTSPPKAEENGGMGSGKMMLLFGGMMAVCCALPLLLVSGLSLAWLTESPAVAIGAVAAVGVLAWRFSRKGTGCKSSKQSADSAESTNDRG
jgi:hypothetical protein